jgi:hypothetical protein
MEPLRAAGRTGTVTFDGHLVTLAPSRAARIGGRARGDIQLPVRAINGVQLSPARAGFLGFIRFVTSGSPASMNRKEAHRDPYTILFTRPAGAEFEAVRDAVMAAITA